MRNSKVKPPMTKVQKLAKEYQNDYGDSYKDYFGFIHGYSTKEQEIKDLIEKLELTKVSKIEFGTKEMMDNYTAEQERKIDLLKILLHEQK